VVRASSLVEQSTATKDDEALAAWTSPQIAPAAAPGTTAAARRVDDPWTATLYHAPMRWFASDTERYRTLAAGRVVPEPRRCVQCGVCSFNCPMGIDVRRYAWLASPVSDPGCLTCGECVRRCPRGLLRFAPIAAAPARDREDGEP